MSAETISVEVNGVRLAVVCEGEGPLALLLHGFPDTPRTWDAVRPALVALGFRVAAPFLRGYAPSAIPADGRYDADTLGRDAAGLIDALGAKDAVVIGHDFGAGAALSAATLFPEKVRMLVTMAIPHPATVVPTPRLLWTVRHFVTLRLPGAAGRIRRGELRHLDELVQRWSPAWTVPPGETDAVKESLRPAGHLEAALAYYAALSPRLPPGQRLRVGVPSAAFAGLHDNIAPEAFDRAARMYDGPYEVVRVPGGHFMHREHPEPFARELVRLLRPFVTGTAAARP